jgi:hypothetical protein
MTRPRPGLCWPQRLLAAIALLAVVAASAAVAYAQEVSPDRQAIILVRALSYDGSLKSRAGSELVIAIVAKPGNAASEKAAGAALQAFGALVATRVQGLPVKAAALAYRGPAALDAAIKSQGIAALYLCPGLENDLDAILAVTRAQKRISIGAREDYVVKGVSLGVFAFEGRPTIHVNLGGSRSEGSEFGSDLLRLSKVIK